MDELGRRELTEVEATQEGELLKTDRAGCPRLRLADREPAVVEGRDGLDRRAPRGQVLSGEQATLGGGEAVDLIRDEALVVRDARLLDLILA
jgi:hypothetical protein